MTIETDKVRISIETTRYHIYYRIIIDDVQVTLRYDYDYKEGFRMIINDLLQNNLDEEKMAALELLSNYKSIEKKTALLVDYWTGKLKFEDLCQRVSLRNYIYDRVQKLNQQIDEYFYKYRNFTASNLGRTLSHRYDVKAACIDEKIYIFELGSVYHILSYVGYFTTKSTKTIVQVFQKKEVDTRWKTLRRMRITKYIIDKIRPFDAKLAEALAVSHLLLDY